MAHGNNEVHSPLIVAWKKMKCISCPGLNGRQLFFFYFFVILYWINDQCDAFIIYEFLIFQFHNEDFPIYQLAIMYSSGIL